MHSPTAAAAVPKRDLRFLRCAPCRDRDLLRWDWPQPHRFVAFEVEEGSAMPALRPLTGFERRC